MWFPLLTFSVFTLLQPLLCVVLADLPSTLVFTPRLAGVSCYRIPAAVRTPLKGGGEAVLAFAEARHGSCDDRAAQQIALRRSLDGGLHWSNVTMIAGNASYMVGNPSAVTLSNGTVIVVFVRHGPKCTGDCGIGNAFVSSSDGGVTWSQPVDISTELGAAKGGMPGPGTALQLSESHPFHPGRILIVSHMGAYVKDFVSYSDDGGNTWSTIDSPFPKMDEAAMTELPNGSVLLNMRHQLSPAVGRAISVSDDGGSTFGPISYDRTLVSPKCQGSIVSFNNQTYFSNPADHLSRDDITIRRSTDNARTWPRRILVHAGPTFGYSCLVKGALTSKGGKTGGILFESSGQTIEFAHFPLEF